MDIEAKDSSKNLNEDVDNKKTDQVLNESQKPQVDEPKPQEPIRTAQDNAQSGTFSNKDAANTNLKPNGNSNLNLDSSGAPARNPLKVNTDSKNSFEQKSEILSELPLEQVLKINTMTVDFGNVFPGQILEETVIILNNLSNTKVPFKIKVNCLTKEYEELDEYVFSMRRPSPNDVFNYNDTFLILLAQKAVSYYKLAIKVPADKQEREIIGNVEISSEECHPGNPLIIAVKANIVFPNIKCEKMMNLKSLGFPVVKLFMKTIRRQDFRISLKNLAKVNCAVELSVLKNEGETGFAEFNFFPPQLPVNPGVSSNFVMSIKCTFSDTEFENKEIRAVLVAKVKNSTIMFAFPLLILFGEGKLVA